MTASTPAASPFPPLDQQLGHKRRPLRAKLVAGGAVVAVVLASAGAAVAMRSPAPSGYRTATVATRAVRQTIDGTGTIEPVSQATIAFAASGTVGRVDVAVGDNVTLGQTLAALDASSLQATVTDNKATLAAAELTLHQALNGETITGGSGGSGSGGTRPASTSASSVLKVEYVVAAKGVPTDASSPTPSGTTSAPTEAQIKAAQQAVLDAKKQVDADLATAQKALDDANAACATSSATDPTSTTTSTTTPASGTDACQAALQQVLVDQQAVATSQAALADASNHLNDLITQAARALANGSSTTPSTTPSTGAGQSNGGESATTRTFGSGSPSSRGSGSGGGTGSGAGTGSGGQGGTGGTGSSASTGSSPSAEQLVAYQADVDAASAKVTEAEQALGQANLTSPVAGTVKAVNLTAGDQVSAGSSTADIVVVGSGGYEVSTTVTVDDLDTLRVGAAATVRPDGSDTTLTGKVVSIGVTPTSSSTTTYPVVIGFTATPKGLNNGASAATSIVLEESKRGLAVPTSAVRSANGRHVVTVLEGGRTTTQLVQIGAVGKTYTAITSGLTTGQQVVLADLAEPLPSSASQQGTNANNGLRFRFAGGGAGAFPGGARPGGG